MTVLEVELRTNVYIIRPKYEPPLCEQCEKLAISPKHTSCGKMLCLNCWKDRPSCQHCDNDTCTTFAPNDFVIHTFLPFHCSCPFLHRGCKKIIPILHVDSHVKYCPYSTNPCDECEVPVDNIDLQQHLRERCTERSMPCTDCPEVIKVSEHQAHRAEMHPICVGCKERYHLPTEHQQHQLVQCSMCSQKVLTCMMDAHMAGHVETLLVDLKVERKQLQKDEALMNELIQIETDARLKQMQDDHYIFKHCMHFSQQHRTDEIQLLEGGRVASRLGSYGYYSAIANHPGLDAGVCEWELRVVRMKGNIFLGVSPPGLVGDCPGSASMAGSIGLYSHGEVYTQSDWSRPKGRFRYSAGDVILLRIDFTARTVTWTREKQPAKALSYPLPQAGPYVPAVGLWGKGTAIRIDAFRFL